MDRTNTKGLPKDPEQENTRGLERRPVAGHIYEGDVLDTTTIEALTAEEEVEYEQLVAKAKKDAEPDQREVIDRYVQAEVRRRVGQQVEEAAQAIIDATDTKREAMASGTDAEMEEAIRAEQTRKIELEAREGKQAALQETAKLVDQERLAAISERRDIEHTFHNAVKELAKQKLEDSGIKPFVGIIAAVCRMQAAQHGSAPDYVERKLLDLLPRSGELPEVLKI